MQITLVSSGDTVFDVLDEFVSCFCVNQSELNSFADSQYLRLRASINELKEMVDFLVSKFVLNPNSSPKRNSKLSLSNWITEVLWAAQQAVQIDDRASEAIAAQSVDTLSETDSTSGLIISFGKTLEFLPHKTVTRRTWKDAHAQKFISAIDQKRLVQAFDKDPRYGGKRIGWCRLLCAPYKERLCDMPMGDLVLEGGMCDTIDEFIDKYFDGNRQLEAWVIRFDFIPDLVLAAETNPAASADQVADFPSPEIEVLEPEKQPVYKISIHSHEQVNVKDCEGCGFTEELVSALPPYLLDRQGNLFERSSCPAPSYNASYEQIVFQHLSNIAEEYAQSIELTTDDLVGYKVNVHGKPPRYVVHKRGVYKRMTWGVISLGKVVKYAQVVSEHLSNIVVV